VSVFRLPSRDVDIDSEPGLGTIFLFGPLRNLFSFINRHMQIQSAREGFFGHPVRPRHMHFEAQLLQRPWLAGREPP